MALLTLRALIFHRPIPQNWAWPIVALIFIIASFLAWRKERQSVDQRIFIDQPLSALIRPYEEHTTIEADRLMSSYRGKWLKVNGEVYQVSKGFRLRSHRVTLFIDRIVLNLEFGPEWDERVLILHKGQPLSAAGKIAFIHQSEIRLEKCEILPLAPEQHA